MHAIRCKGAGDRKVVAVTWGHGVLPSQKPCVAGRCAQGVFHRGGKFAPQVVVATGSVKQWLRHRLFDISFLNSMTKKEKHVVNISMIICMYEYIYFLQDLLT